MSHESGDITTAAVGSARAGSASSTAVGAADYIPVTAIFALFGVVLVLATRTPPAQLPIERLVPPLVALVALTALVWLLMVVFRNYAVLRGLAKVSKLGVGRQTLDAPPDWVERPARTFDNLLQVPVLFYALTALAMSMGHVDQAQLNLAWIFVFTRCVHAGIFIGWNHIPYRFAAWNAGCVTLAVLWFRFAAQAWPK